MSDRPRLKPWLRPVLRGGDEAQFGFAEDGLILSGITAAEVGLLRSLDGTRSRLETFGDARRAGVTATRWRTLLDLMAHLDLLEPDDPAPPVPAGRHVLVDGAGPVSTEIALLLGRFGVARVTHGRPSVDLVLAEPVRHRPDLVVLTGAGALDPRSADVWFHHRVPHLPVVPHGPAVSIGPVVHGDPASPCLRCLDLHRTDRDHAWSAVVSQLAAGADRLVPGSSEPDGLPVGAVPFIAAGVVLLALGLLSGHLPPQGLALEVGSPWPRVDHRRWTRHPRCGHHLDGDADVA
jgi:hypothetical protein